MITKEEVTAELDRIILTSAQNDKGQYPMGDAGQANAALFIESLITQDPELNATVAATALLALQDIQVRDYAMGLLTPGDEVVASRLQWLTDVAPDNYIAPSATLLALTYYEKSDTDKAFELLSKAASDNPRYALTTLLRRVFGSGWPVEAFHAMRQELHPKVTKGIFGESNDNSK